MLPARAPPVWLDGVSLILAEPEAERLLDEAFEAYLRWREEAAAVELAYSRWRETGGRAARGAFTMFGLRLGREERAAQEYERVLAALDARMASGGRSPRGGSPRLRSR